MQNTSTYNTTRNRVRKVVLKNGGAIVEERFYVGDYEYFVRTGGSNAVERKTLKISDDKQVIALYESDNTICKNEV